MPLPFGSYIRTNILTTRPSPIRLLWHLTVTTAIYLTVRDEIASTCFVVGDSMSPTLSPRWRETRERDRVLLWHWPSTWHKYRNTAAEQQQQQEQQRTAVEAEGEGGKWSWRALVGDWSSWNRNDVRRGDVVSFYTPHGKGDRMGIKRVVALGGDTVHVRQRERYGDKYRLVADSTSSSVASTESIVVPYGHVWVEGDHAERSTDSRDYGPISLALITGKVKWILLPFDRFGPVSQEASETSSRVKRGVARRPNELDDNTP